MPIVGFNFRSISARANDEVAGKEVGVNSSPVIEAIKKKELNVLGVKEVLSIEFRFTTRYEPKVGEISITGEVLYQTDNSKKILEMWKSKKLESKLAVDVLNVIFRRCLVKSISIADELRLPPPLNFPLVKAEAPPEKKGQAS